VTEFVQQLVDGLGRGSEYALIALGIAVMFGVMHLVNFAYGVLITVSGYVAFAVLDAGYSWGVAIPAIVAVAVVTSMLTELVAFRRVRGADDATMLLTSFGLFFVVSALFVMFAGPNVKNFERPSWVTDTVTVGSIRLEVFDLTTLAVTAVTLAGTAFLIRKTMFGITLRAAAADFDAARLMGVRSNRVIQGAFALAGLLAGIASVFILMRSGRTSPTFGETAMLKGILAALIGGLGSLSGAVIGGFVLGLVEVLLIARLPDGLVGLTNGIVFLLIALLFIFRPGGIVSVRHAERV
jgi:branched-chain amino acid transport system permease protein